MNASHTARECLEVATLICKRYPEFHRLLSTESYGRGSCMIKYQDKENGKIYEFIVSAVEPEGKN